MNGQAAGIKYVDLLPHKDFAELGAYSARQPCRNEFALSIKKCLTLICPAGPSITQPETGTAIRPVSSGERMEDASIWMQNAAPCFHLDNRIYFLLSGIAEHKFKIFHSQQKSLKPASRFNSIQ